MTVGPADLILDNHQSKETTMYTSEQKKKALELFDKTKSIAEVIRQLGYPSKQAMYTWIANRNKPWRAPNGFRGINTAEHPRHPSAELKFSAIKACFEDGKDVQLVSAQIGYSRASIYTWRKKYLKEGMLGLMNTKDRKRGKLASANENPEKDSSSSKEIQQLKDQLYEMQMEIDILKATIDVLKKDPGINLDMLKNSEKTVMIDALRTKYALSDLLHRLSLSRSSYYFQRAILRRHDKYESLKVKITEIHTESRKTYGYRRIKAELDKENIRVSEKVVRRLMRELGLSVQQAHHAKYNSYKGEISPAVENLLNRDFKADKPNKKWLTDITEFGLPEGKVYLSPMIDCFDGLPVAWTIGTSPNAALANIMLEKAIGTLAPGEKPIVHSDRGCHYRWPGWIKRMHAAGLTRSMSKKGCSPDNSACEGFFGHLKNEMFYNRSWNGVSVKQFISILNDYILWYREKRIKLSLGGLSPIEYRKRLGLI